jgi:uncharacterized protein (DUF1800 family)
MLGSAQEGTNTGLQLGKVEWLGDVVVGTGVKSEHLVARRVACGEHQDPGWPFGAVKFATQRQAVPVRETEIEHDDVVHGERDRFACRCQRRCQIDSVPVLDKTPLHDTAQGCVVFHHEYSHEDPSSHSFDEAHVKDGFTFTSSTNEHHGRVADGTLVHLLGRLTFGPNPQQLERFAGQDTQVVIDTLLSEAPLPISEPSLGSDEDYERVTKWWVDILADPQAGLHERMVWFWHGHLTSSLDKASPRLMVRQQALLREHALGNFRTLLQAITVDGAMLNWLDGNYSSPDDPNENYARELMELFALGLDAGYTERDIRNGAIALSGWWVDDENDDEVRFNDEYEYPSVEFLGATVSTAAEVVDAVCDHPACAPFIAGRLYRSFHGVDPDDATRARLAATFVDNGLEIRPLLEAVVRDPSFLDHRSNRTRSPLEWYVALRHLVQVDVSFWALAELGQLPFHPSNVAGWKESQWSSVGVELTKARLAWDAHWEADAPQTDDPITEFAERCGLVLSDETTDVLRGSIGGEDDWEPFRTVYGLLPLCPEFNLA